MIPTAMMNAEFFERGFIKLNSGRIIWAKDLVSSAWEPNSFIPGYPEYNEGGVLSLELKDGEIVLVSTPFAFVIPEESPPDNSMSQDEILSDWDKLMKGETNI